MRTTKRTTTRSAMAAIGTAGVCAALLTAPGLAQAAPHDQRDDRVSAAAKPAFQMPFPCGTKWQLNTWGHSPALDMVVKGNTGSDGKPVLASAKGTVSATYKDTGSGNTIQVSHGGGWFTAYYHLKDAPTKYVQKGDKVKASTKIGRIGTSGNSGWAHLHYEQRYLASGNFTDERHRKAVHFNGVRYTGSNKEWPSVTSRNCVA
ncbi:M23 family metallopeptidase [Streptomyces durmitorensis]|uniref:M23 family metallopeptidase n=1 Tax=Streptomyces durmitorensis TaxID=319947 RepID=A0ABY4PV20_9ACTN|nr:M23 family metallopeptidase [Streptomyces durmitorensis]UQT56799.1 M23 family metallopeptidase [Streptomyces durmitorensis]